MKAEDLMIGDLVKFPHGIDKVCDLPYVEGRGMCASFSVSATLFSVPVEMLEPVPLTSEILVKNGFKKHNSYGTEKFRLNDKVTVNLYGADKWLLRVDAPYNFGTTYIIFRYFHELQHALKLVGINLEIKV